MNMGCEVDLPSGCMFDWVCIHTVPYFERGEMFYIGRLNMSSMQKMGVRYTNKGKPL